MTQSTHNSIYTLLNLLLTEKLGRNYNEDQTITRVGLKRTCVRFLTTSVPDSCCQSRALPIKKLAQNRPQDAFNLNFT